VVREIEGLDTCDTAESPGIREATVKTRLHRARAQLRSTLLDRIDIAPRDLLEFGGERCNSVVARVMDRLATECG
jgi:RNA polymerase sigma-70 factor (ECF subfamily)